MTRTKKPKQEKEEDIIYTLPQLRKILKPKMKQFCAEYIRNGWNRTAAYSKIYKQKNKNAASTNASQQLQKTTIKQYIAYIKDDFEMLCGVSKASQVAEYRKIAYGSIGALHNKWIELKKLEDLKKKNPHIVDAIESTESKTVWSTNEYKEPIRIEFIKVKMHSKLTALQRIDKLMDYEVAEKIEHSGEVTSTFDITKYSAEEKKVLLKLSRQNEYKD